MSSSTSAQALQDWHPGEKAVQSMMNLPSHVPLAAVVNRLPEQHRVFHTSRLYFLPVTTLDDQGRPWASLLAAPNGDRGFINSPSDKILEIEARVWDGDPIVDNLRGFTRRKNVLVSGVGVETSTRRRNKFGGHVSDASIRGKHLSLQLTVNQALGNCPKYINVRTLTPFPETSPRLIHRNLDMSSEQRLPDDLIEFIHAADTAYLATSYVARPEDAVKCPSHVGTNHRGGRPGFIRVLPTDGRTLVIPDYAGNRIMSSLGNIHVTPLAGLVFPSFTTGSILYITGTAETLFGSAAQSLMPSMNVVTTIRATGYAFVSAALPFRQAPHTDVEPSPYSPPVHFLAEESSPAASGDDSPATLVRAQIHDATLATYTFTASRAVDVRPGQSVVLDLGELVRVRAPALLDWAHHTSTTRDDCVRTWTVTVNPTRADPRTFSITTRVVRTGLVTPLLYGIAASHASFDGRADLSELELTVKLRGIGGDIPAPEPIAACDGGRRLLWMAGGIGVTPFLSLTRHVAGLAARTYGLWDVVLVLSTREPDVMLALVADALQAAGASPSGLSYAVHLFTPCAVSVPSPLPAFVALHVHEGRLDARGEFFERLGAKDRELQICGPLPFVQTAMAALQDAGVDAEQVKRERFTF